MAVDKLVDSTQLDADLTSVANAIRTKGGTSAQLSFPSGFVSAINNIPTGGGGSVTAETGTVTLASDYALSTAATGDVFPGLKLNFVPDFFYMTMENASWDEIATPSGALYGFVIVKKAITPPFRINSSMSTDGLSLDYYAYGMHNTVSASDVSNGVAINGFAMLGSGYVERFHFDSDGYVYVGRYSSASTYAKAGTYRYFAYKLPTT